MVVVLLGHCLLYRRPFPSASGGALHHRRGALMERWKRWGPVAVSESPSEPSNSFVANSADSWRERITSPDHGSRSAAQVFWP